jgi:hypothetical protein
MSGSSGKAVVISQTRDRCETATLLPLRIRYPFWFGGSASCFAACLTHPLDLGKFCNLPFKVTVDKFCFLTIALSPLVKVSYPSDARFGDKLLIDSYTNRFGFKSVNLMHRSLCWGLLYMLRRMTVFWDCTVGYVSLFACVYLFPPLPGKNMIIRCLLVFKTRPVHLL